jgi:hypothetical protein
MNRTMLSRRTVLRGLGASVALPMLDAMIPAGGIAKAASNIVAGATGKVATPPVRMAALFLPNGMSIENWLPDGAGANWKLSPTLAPFEAVKSEISPMVGLSLHNAYALGDGGGDHARSAAAFLTGMHPYKTAGKDIRVGISMDQVAAQAIGDRTAFPSLELGLDKSGKAGDCDTGYSCAYVSNVAWRSPTMPLPHEVDPAAMFDRLFGAAGDTPEQHVNRERRLRERRSILDFVLSDTRRLNGRLGSSDRQKLDEFTTSIRQIEKRIDAARSAKPLPKPDMARPDGIPERFSEHMELMFDLLVLAFRMDLTRVSTYMVARDGSDRAYPEAGVTDGHHTMSHHGNDPHKIKSIKKIDLFHMQQIARFVQKLHETKEGEGTLLENSMVVIGCGISDGDRHNHNDLPILLAGRGGGAIQQGIVRKYDRNTPLCNLYVSMLNNMGIQTTRFGDSTGPLTNLS